MLAYHLVQAREKDLQVRDKDCERASSRAVQAETALSEAKQVRLTGISPSLAVVSIQHVRHSACAQGVLQQD